MTTPTTNHRPQQIRPGSRPASPSQPKTVCVPLLALEGDSYRLKDRDLGPVPTPATDEP
jgi:hypothetical protein